MDRLVTYEAIDHFVVVTKRSPNIGIDTVRHTFIIAVTHDCELDVAGAYLRGNRRHGASTAY